MRNLETGKEKIQKICDAIRKETLDPAKQEAREIVENAHLQAAQILREAKEKEELLKKETEKEIAEKRRTFQSSLQLSCRQGLEAFKQKIEQELFNRELSSLVDHEMAKPQLIAQIVEGFIRTLEQQGIDEDFDILIPKQITPRSINTLLSSSILKRLKESSVQIGDFHGGAQIRLKDRKLTIDFSEAFVKELIGSYIRRDFRDLLFQV
ncbi:MAG TPA: hypothetical protein VGM34_03440 [Chlamydiales bacterium]|jgi:V/A-type H+-transporting ATPase subunit E